MINRNPGANPFPDDLDDLHNYTAPPPHRIVTFHATVYGGGADGIVFLHAHKARRRWWRRLLGWLCHE